MGVLKVRIRKGHCEYTKFFWGGLYIRPGVKVTGPRLTLAARLEERKKVAPAGAPKSG